MSKRPQDDPKSAADPLNVFNVPDKNDVEFLAASGRLLESQGELLAAKEQYEKAIKVSPKHLVSLTRLARINHRQGRNAQAIALYQRAAKAHPKSAVVQNDLGLCYARSGNSKAAIKAMQRAVKLSPASVLYRNNLATVMVDLGHTDAALSHFSHGQDRATAHFNVGYLLFHKGRRQEASKHFRQALQLSPNFQQARQMLGEIQASAPKRTSQAPAIARRQTRRTPQRPATQRPATQQQGAPNRIRPQYQSNQGQIVRPQSNQPTGGIPLSDASTLLSADQNVRPPVALPVARYNYLQNASWMVEQTPGNKVDSSPHQTSTGLVLPASYAEPSYVEPTSNSTASDRQSKNVAPLPLPFDTYSPKRRTHAPLLPQVITADQLQ